MKRQFICLLSAGMILSTLGGCSSVDFLDTISITKEPAKIQSIRAEELTKDTFDPSSMDVEVVSYEDIYDFSYELLKMQLNEVNPIISPASAYLALSLTGNGARGETLDEFHEVLGDNLQLIPYDIIQGFNRNKPEMKISLANSVWIDDRLEAKDTFLSAADTYFDAEVYRRELASETAMKDMNIWVNSKTNGMIPSMIDKPLSHETAMVLFNTIYFNGKWEVPFKAYDTREFEFKTENDEVITIPMMQQFDTDLRYVKNDIAEGVILPYKDEDIVFLALKPLGEMTVREMYSLLSREEMLGFLDQEELTLSRLRLPKFEVSFEKELNDTLKEMGLEKAFDPAYADLSGLGSIPDGENLYISLVKQKAKLILDEEGTEASAATKVELAEGCMEYSTPPVNIYFDQPFLYMIVQKNNGVPLFMGIMDEPEN